GEPMSSGSNTRLQRASAQLADLTLTTSMGAVLQEPCDENIIRSAPEATPCSKARGRWILAATILASSMAFIDGTVVNVALPALQTNLKATAVDVQWGIESYALLLSALL